MLRQIRQVRILFFGCFKEMGFNWANVRSTQYKKRPAFFKGGGEGLEDFEMGTFDKYIAIFYYIDEIKTE